jgi:hypothetical protein
LIPLLTDQPIRHPGSDSVKVTGQSTGGWSGSLAAPPAASDLDER